MTETDVYNGLDLDDQILAHLATPGGAKIAHDLDPALLTKTTAAALVFWLEYEGEYGAPPPPEILADEVGVEDFPEAVGEPEYWRDLLLAEQLREDGGVALVKASEIGEHNPFAAMTFIKEESARLLAKAITNAPSGTYGVDGSVDYYLNRHNATKTGLTFGFNQVDEVLGGLRRQELVTLVARTKRYKSWLLQKSFVGSWRNGRQVAFATLELPEDEFKLRVNCMIGGVSWRRAGAGALVEDEMARLSEVEGWLRDPEENPVRPYIFSLPKAQCTAAQLAAVAVEHGAEALYIDQYSFMLPEDPALRGAADWEKFTGVAQDLKDVAKEHNLAVVVAAQLNRPGEMARKFSEISAAHIARSDYLGQVSDLVMGSFATYHMKEESRVLHYGVVESRAFEQTAWEVNIQLDDKADFQVVGKVNLESDDDD